MRKKATGASTPSEQLPHTCLLFFFSRLRHIADLRFALYVFFHLLPASYSSLSLMSLVERVNLLFII